MIDVNPNYLDTVTRILAGHVPECEVRAFGSRVTWTAKDYSDLDLAVVGERALDSDALRRLKEAFEESDLPFRVDVLDWHAISPSFQKVIEKKYEVLQKGRKNSLGMAGEWPLVTVGELADSVSDTHKFGKDHLIFLNTSDVLLGKILHHSYSSVCGWPGQAKKSIRRDDILFSEIRPANGRWAYVDIDADDYVVSTKLMVIRARRNHAVPRFLFHFLTSTATTRWLQHLAESRSGTFPQITFDQVAALELALPPLGAQATIAEFLDCITSKIELNRRMNETLEAMARALFKSWFVDFDPVRAKAEGRDPGLPQPIADLFPDSFEDSELGEIPKGWDVIPLPNAIEVNPTRSLRKGEVAPYLDMANMPSQGHTPDAVIDRPFGSGMRFMNGDTLVARITPCLENGKTAYVDCLQESQVGWGSTEFIVMRPKPPLPEEFAYCLARNERFREFAIQSMTGSSGRQRVPVESLSHYLLAAPPKQVAKRFGSLVRPLFARASAAAREAHALAALRDTLLPKLISGELRVPRLTYIAGSHKP